MRISRRQLLEIIGAGSIAAALPVALLEKLGGVRTLTSGAARITTQTDLGVLQWEIPYVEFARGLTVEYREIRDREEAAGLEGVPTVEVRENGMQPWRQVGIVDSMTFELGRHLEGSTNPYGSIEILEEAS